MIDGAVNKKSGILVVELPSASNNFCTSAYGDGEKALVHPEVSNWTSISSRDEYEKRYPFMPARIIDNLLAAQAYVSVVQWDKIANDPEKLRVLIELTHSDRARCQYDLSRALRRRNN